MDGHRGAAYSVYVPAKEISRRLIVITDEIWFCWTRQRGNRSQRNVYNILLFYTLINIHRHYINTHYFVLCGGALPREFWSSRRYLPRVRHQKVIQNIYTIARENDYCFKLPTIILWSLVIWRRFLIIVKTTNEQCGWEFLTIFFLFLAKLNAKTNKRYYKQF